MSTTPNIPPVPPDASGPTAAATPVTEKRIAPAGAIPKQMQSWIFLAILTVVAVGLWFSGMGKKPKSTAGTTAQPTTQVKPMVAGLTPDEVQKRLQESEDTRRTEARNSGDSQPPQLSDAHLVNASTQSSTSSQAMPTPPAVDPIAEEERKREYAARFASNIALSYRADSHAGNSTPHAPTPISTVNADATSGAASLSASFQQQLEQLQAQQHQQIKPYQQTAESAQPVSTQSPQSQKTAVPARKNTELNAAPGKNHVIFEGAVLESVLVNRLNGDFAGPVICQTTTDIYSHNRDELLVPAGSRLLGETKKISEVGEERLAVIFHRLIMPDGYAVDLDQAPGLNQIGETALHDKVNNHYFKIFGASIAVGAIAGLASVGTNNSAVTGLPASNSSAYREGVTESLSQSSLHILDRFLNIPPTITIREGHRVRVFLTQDLLVPAYAQHKMPSDL
jgi:type IV secretory pathway VirB10-like protein